MPSKSRIYAFSNKKCFQVFSDFPTKSSRKIQAMKTIQLFRFQYISTILISLASVIISCSDPLASDTSNSRNVANLDMMMAAWAKDNTAMGGVAFTRGGRILYQNFTGFRTINAGAPVKSDSTTIYQVASMTKMFTSVIIHQLIEERRLTLSTKLSEFYPQIKNSENITIRHMLEHRSGLHNWTTDEDLASWSFSPQTREQMVARFATYTPEFTPDARRYYSNTNYSLLGFIIERLTQSTYAEQVRIRIVNKIGLKNTYDGTATTAGRLTEAQSYSKGLFEWTVVPKTHISTLVGTGSIYSTPLDICRFLEALFDGKLVNATSLQSITTPNPDVTGDLGKGIDKEKLYSGTLDTFTKSARIDGFTGQAFYFPDDRTACVVIFNGFTRTNLVFEPARVFYGK